MNENIIHVCPGINQIFSVPIFVSEEEYVLSEKQKEIILNEERQTNAHNFSSIDSNVLDNPNLKRLKYFCQDQIDYYVHALLKIKMCEFYITQSWTNYTETNQSHHQHTHGNSVVSGVYYFAPEISTIVFYRRDELFPSFRFNYESYDANTSLNMKIQVPKNRIILFPSCLPHSVEDYEDEETRISVALNTFVKGSLGDYDGKTLLEL